MREPSWVICHAAVHSFVIDARNCTNCYWIFTLNVFLLKNIMDSFSYNYLFFAYFCVTLLDL